MTTDTALVPSANALLAELERERADLPDPRELERAAEALHHRHAALDALIETIRLAMSILANVEPTIAALSRWFDEMTGWRKTLCDELLAMPGRVYTERELGKQQALKLSVIAIDRGLPDGTGFSLEFLPIGNLMREAGYVESTRIENQRCGRLPWFGSLPDVEHRLRELRAQRDDAMHRLAEAMREEPDTISG